MNTAFTRRSFIKTASIGASAVAFSARSYARIIGTNERLRIGLIGCGSRGVGAHMKGVHPFSQQQNVEFVAVCDPWKQHRQEAAALTQEWYGQKAVECVSYRDLLEVEDLDAVMIASCDHQHTTHLKAAAEAGKHVYVEKPLAMDLETLKQACDAVKESGVTVQVGTQLRSYPSFTGCRKLVGNGLFGTISRIEQCRNAERPYWYTRVEDIRKEDVDWGEFLMNRPMRPFDPYQYTGWYGYREFSDGPVPGLGSHFIDLVHYITGARYPDSCVCLGGSYVYNKDKYRFTCPDQVQALWTYPEGFLVSYSTNFGNGSGNSFKLFGSKGVLDMEQWTAPFYTAQGGPQRDGSIRGENPVEPVERPDHFLDWLQCIRNGRTPNAPIEAGYQHAVAVIMAMKSFDTGKRTEYDHEKRALLQA